MVFCLRPPAWRLHGLLRPTAWHWRARCSLGRPVRVVLNLGLVFDFRFAHRDRLGCTFRLTGVTIICSGTFEQERNRFVQRLF